MEIFSLTLLLYDLGQVSGVNPKWHLGFHIDLSKILKFKGSVVKDF